MNKRFANIFLRPCFISGLNSFVHSYGIFVTGVSHFAADHEILENSGASVLHPRERTRSLSDILHPPLSLSISRLFSALHTYVYTDIHSLIIFTWCSSNTRVKNLPVLRVNVISSTRRKKTIVLHRSFKTFAHILCVSFSYTSFSLANRKQ